MTRPSLKGPSYFSPHAGGIAPAFENPNDVESVTPSSVHEPARAASIKRADVEQN
ncbi:MAG: hypothetical protein ACI9W2_001338 [Gammaproteobacteria bacterium]|jgi:hypothetical protein